MNTSNKCTSCHLNKSCDFIKNGKTCYNDLNSTSYEEECSLLQSSAIDVEFKNNDCDVRLDLVVNKKIIYKLWGQVKDVEGNIVDFALITLLKPYYYRGKIEYTPVSTTSSDAMGFYYFETTKLEKGLKYIVTVTKS